MSQQTTAIRRHDPGLKWFVVGGVASLGILTFFLAFIAFDIADSQSFFFKCFKS